jgi:hypothetical protein
MLPLKDLNYRLTLPDPDVRSLLYSGPKPQEIKTLLQFDEVRLLKATSRWSLLTYSPAAVEEFHSSLQSIRGV